MAGRPLCAAGGTRGRIVSLSLSQRYAASESEQVMWGNVVRAGASTWDARVNPRSQPEFMTDGARS